MSNKPRLAPAIARRISPRYARRPSWGPSAGWAGDPGPVGVGDGLRSIAQAGLGEQMVDVRLDGRRADDESLGDFGVAQPLGYQRQHFRLARGEIVGALRAGG